MTVKELHEQVMANLNALGFRPARILQPRSDAALRPHNEIASRLLALNALFARVTATETDLSSDALRDYVERDNLLEFLTESERAIMSMERSDARRDHIETIGWKLENMWSLAWVLGFDPAPGLDASQISRDVSVKIVMEFLGDISKSTNDLLADAAPRSPDEVISFEFYFYCAHNAVRSAQLGRDTVPPGFDAIAHGGAVHERRHALTWCLSQGVSWDDTDLST